MKNVSIVFVLFLIIVSIIMVAVVFGSKHKLPTNGSIVTIEAHGWVFENIVFDNKMIPAGQMIAIVIKEIAHSPVLHGKLTDRKTRIYYSGRLMLSIGQYESLESNRAWYPQRYQIEIMDKKSTFGYFEVTREYALKARIGDTFNKDDGEYLR